MNVPSSANYNHTPLGCGYLGLRRHCLLFPIQHIPLGCAYNWKQTVLNTLPHFHHKHRLQSQEVRAYTEFQRIQCTMFCCPPRRRELRHSRVQYDVQLTNVDPMDVLDNMFQYSHPSDILVVLEIVVWIYHPVFEIQSCRQKRRCETLLGLCL